MDSLDSLLSKRLNKLGLSKELQAAYIVSQANIIANGRFTAIRFARGILTISCPNSITANEIRYDSEKIINEINEKIKPTTIKRLSYKISG